MNRYVLSPRAQKDLDEIWDYGYAQWGREVVDHCARLLQKAIETIADDPRRGKSCSELRRGYFKFSVGSHILFYVLTQDAIDVKRILHQEQGLRPAPVMTAGEATVLARRTSARRT